MRPADPGSFDIADFLAATKNNIEQMWKRLRTIIEGVQHPDLSALIAEFLADEPLMEGFRRAPAAATMHHAYIGGLLEHTLSLLELDAWLNGLASAFSSEKHPLHDNWVQ